ncbi:hypothetical protein HDU85_005211 [Gaertneriomyces sp. JEL0708]|nr:hypothetical protein HDU85_005211 [Gaertneriomyces sp. JEL0708]
MITVAIVLFCFAFISGVYRGIQRLDTTSFPGWEKGIRYNIVCYCVFTLYILAMDTVLSFLMYKRICILKSQLDAIGLTTETPSHRRTIYGMIGLVGMSWIAVTTFVITSFAPNMDRVVRAVLAVIAMSMSIVHMSFALLYLESIRRLMTSFDFAQALAPEGDLKISGKV